VVVSKEIARLEHSAVKLSLVVAKDDVRTQYDELIASYAKKVQIKGFRVGKVPKDVLERKFGDALKSETVGRVMEKAMEEALQDIAEKPLPYSTPSVDAEPELAFDKDLSFSVVYDVFPTVLVGEWKGTEIEVPVSSVENEDIDRELEQIRDRNAVVLDKDDDAKAAKGDVATVDYVELDEAGAVVPGTERQGFAFTIGSEMNIFHFDDEVVGMKKGETKDFDKTYAEDFSDKDLAGKTKKLRVTLSALKEKKLPDLDDELAQDVSEKYKTLSDLKKDITERLGKNLEARLRELKMNTFLEKVLEKTTIDLPESMIRIELDSRWRNLARRFNTDSEQLLRIVESNGDSYENLLAQWRPDVEKALKARLVVDNLGKELGVDVSDEELEKEYEVMASSMDTTAEEVKKHYEGQQMQDYLKEDIKERKLFDLLLAETKQKKGKKTKYLDLVGNNG